MNINAGDYYNKSSGMNNYSTGSIEITGGKIKVEGNATMCGVGNYTTGTIQMNGGEISLISTQYSRTIYGIENMGTGMVEINEGTINATRTATSKGISYGVYNVSTGSIEISRGIINATSTTSSYGVYNVSTGSINIRGGTINATSNSSYGVYNSSTGTVIIGINDNRISAIEPLIEGQTYGIHNYIGILNVYDGKIKGSIGNAVVGAITQTEEGYELIKTEEEGKEITTLGLLQNEQTEDSVVSVKIGETTKYYQSLIYGISTVGEEQATITMLKDTKEAVSILSSKNIILDLSGREILSEGKETKVISNYGILEIIDSGELGIINATSTTSSYGVYNNNTGSMTISGGRISAISTSYSYGVYNYGGGSVNINGGEISATASSRSSNSYSHGVYNYSTGSIEINGGEINATVSSSPSYSYSYGVYNYSTGSIEINGGEINATSSLNSSYSYGVYNYSTGSIKISGETIISILNSGNSYGVYNYGIGSIEISEGEISVTSRLSSSYGVYNYGTGSIEISGGEISATVNTSSTYPSSYGVYNYSAGMIEISGGEISATVNTSSTYSSSYGVYNHSTGTVTIGINDSTVNVTEPIKPLIQGQDYGVYNSTGILNIYDGKIKGSIGNAVVGAIAQTEEGYELVKTEEEGIEIATLELIQSEQTEDSVASVTIGEKTKYYQSLIYGISTVGEEQATITMIKDTKESVSILSTKNIVLDLNGKQISATGKNIRVIDNYGILEIIDSGETGKISATSTSSSYGVYNNNTGSVIISGGIINATSTFFSSYGVYNNSTGSININGGTINATSKSNISYGAYNNRTGSVIITGGTISATSTSSSSYGVYNNSTGIVTIGINDSEVKVIEPVIESQMYGVYNNSTGSININGGNISATSTRFSYGVYNNSTGNITIGTKGDPTTEETPSITATTNSTSTSYKAYGIYKYNANGKINFYDGTIKAQIAKYGEFTEVEEGYEYVITVIDELENLVLQAITP